MLSLLRHNDNSQAFKTLKALISLLNILLLLFTYTIFENVIKKSLNPWLNIKNNYKPCG